MKITVVGAGGWGTALSMLLHENGHEVTVWCYQKDEADTLNIDRVNRLLPGVIIPKGIHFTTGFETLSSSDAIVMATPSFAVRSVVREAAPQIKKGTLIISVSKGIEKDTSLRLSQVIQEETMNANPVAVLSGPSHAEEVSRKIPTVVVSACEDLKYAEQVQDMFMNSHFRVYTTPDIIGVEICAALKNIIALSSGVCTGLGYGDNTKAALITRGMAEIGRLCVTLGGKRSTCAGLAGVGDLIVTCTSIHSRNYRCGILIGKGKSVEEARKEIGAVVEGYYAAANAEQLAKRMGVEMPIAHSAYQVLYRGADVSAVIHDLMTRSKKSEVEADWY